MASDPISITIDDKEVTKKIGTYIGRLKDPTPALKEIGPVAVRSIKRNFDKGGRPDKWKPSRTRKRDSDAARARARAGKDARGQKTLMDSRNLYGSVAFVVQGKVLLVGSNVPYGPIHHFGGTIKHPGGTPYIITAKGAAWMKKDGTYPEGTKFTKAHDIAIPARPWLLFQKRDYTAFMRILKDHVEKQ